MWMGRELVRVRSKEYVMGSGGGSGSGADNDESVRKREGCCVQVYRHIV